MDDPFQIQLELRYGAPVCDQILTGRHFTIGYSWYFRQAKWALEIVNPNSYLMTEAERQNNFRADTRIPEAFRAGLSDYRRSGYDRGHLVASANHDGRQIQNSETFLLSNMSPQKPELNRRKWNELEQSIRKLNERDDILEVYVLTCPVFYFNKTMETIGDPSDTMGTDIPLPHAFVKSVLAENDNGRLKLWTFEMKNEQLDGDLDDYLVSTYRAERVVGGRFWDRVNDHDLHEMKSKPGTMWDT